MRQKPALLAAMALCALLALACHARDDSGVRIVLMPDAAVSATTAAGQATTPDPAATMPAGSAIKVSAAGVPLDLFQRAAANRLLLGEDRDAELRVSPAAAGEGVAARYWVPVTDLFNDAQGLTRDQVLRVLRGEVTDWAQLGASPAPIQVMLPAEANEELRVLLGESFNAAVGRASGGGASPSGVLAGAVQMVSLQRFAALTHIERGLFALLPLEAVDFHVRALALDGTDLLRGSGDPTAYPLQTRVKVEALRGAGAQEDRRSAETALTAPLPAPVRLLATGDIIPARCVYQRQEALNDYRHAFLAVAPTLRNADLAIGSLDATISDKGTPVGCKETLSLMAPPRSVEGIVYAGIRLLTVAANHAKDCGEEACGDAAFLDTAANLDAAGVAHTGGGRNLAEARTPVVLTVKGLRIAFLGYDDIASQWYGAGERSPGTAPLDLATLGDDIHTAATRADIVVVMIHWGVEYTTDPTERQRQAARVAVDAGATLVVGNHPHSVQAVEGFATGFVEYALGNFVFDQDWSEETLDGAVMEAVFDGPHLRQVAFLPTRIRDMHQPYFTGREDGRPILDRMQQASRRLLDAP